MYHDDEDSVLGTGGVGGAVIGGREKPLTLSRAILAIVILIVVLIAAYWMWVSWTGLGGALTRAGWVIWTSPSCPACRSQRLLLGSSWKYVKNQTCAPGAQCPVQAFPTWRNTKTGESRVGVQNPVQLRRMAQ